MSKIAQRTLSLKHPAELVAPVTASTTMASSVEVDLAEFYFVWCPTEHAPKRRHRTLESAQTEAARLRSIAPTKLFHVYRAERLDDEAVPA